MTFLCFCAQNVLIITCRGGEYELLEWLDKLTFPTETEFGNREHARVVYTGVVNKSLNCGASTSHLYYETRFYYFCRQRHPAISVRRMFLELKF